MVDKVVSDLGIVVKVIAEDKTSGLLKTMTFEFNYFVDTWALKIASDLWTCGACIAFCCVALLPRGSLSRSHINSLLL